MNIDGKPIVAVVAPAYRVRNQIIDTLGGIDDTVDQIYVVDDACPDCSGDLVSECCPDTRVVVLKNEKNLGVGGAVLKGMRSALENQADIIVKLDGDGQHDPRIIPALIAPIVTGSADYCKGNRFVSVESLKDMPTVRLLGNAMLSFITKLSSGYWNLFDPNNGLVAIHARVLEQIPINKLNQGYFFESDMLFRLYIARAKIVEVPMDARYGDENSSLRSLEMILPFLANHTKCLFKRIIYTYFLRGFSIATLLLIFGLLLFCSGVLMGSLAWISYSTAEQSAPAGMVMLPALLIILGFQMLLGFLSADIAAVPDTPVHPLLTNYKKATHSSGSSDR
jgi:glycosyltransferase involved in cell wall biosynthesis